VSLGLAITIGGLLSPAFGALADATSLRVTLAVLTGLPVLALLLATTLRDPRSGPPGGSRVRSAGSAAGRAG
jgi:MFS transporter, FSR family, fosmidomycin resistance protein